MTDTTDEDAMDMIMLAFVAGFAVGSAAPEGLRTESSGRAWLPVLTVLSPMALAYVLVNQQLMAGSTSDAFMGAALLGFGARGLFLVGGAAWRARRERIQDTSPAAGSDH